MRSADPAMQNNRYVISIHKEMVEPIKAYKEKLEKQMGFPVTYGQVISHLIKTVEEKENG
jgi:hypothetical protein